jgi:hypothetical protein
MRRAGGRRGIPPGSIVGWIGRRMIIIAAFHLSSLPEASAQQSVVRWSAFTVGSAVPSSGMNAAPSIVGQMIVGTSAGPVSLVNSGFAGALVSPGGLASISVPHDSLWNLISNPVVRAQGTDSLRQLFSNTTYEYAFTYVPGSGYEQRYTLVHRTGYWVKFTSRGTSAVSGTALTADTFHVRHGWNMVGSISFPADTGSIVSIPPGNRRSIWFCYTGELLPAAQIIPGKGYWIKAETTGVFIVSSGALLRQSEKWASPGLSSLVLRDARGCGQTLYYTREQIHDQSMYDMPPPGPAGVMDARFTSQSLVTSRSEEILLSSATFPVEVSWPGSGAEGMYLSLDGRRFPLNAAGSVKVARASTRITVDVYGSPHRPDTYSLEQNYPNPFNPATTIRFSVAERQTTSIKVFDMLGRKVATLLDEMKEPGSYTVTFDATGLASGVYFYRVQAGMFVQTRKMLLQK